MSAVRMHSPPARTVKRPNQRWARQRPITRGGVSDHEAGGDPPTVTGLSPNNAIHTDPDVLVTVTGTNFVDPATVHVTGNNGPGEFPATVNSETELEFTLTTSYMTMGGGHVVQVETVNGTSAANPPGSTFTIDTP